MSEKQNNTLLILGIGLGLFAGAVFAYLLYKSKQSTQILNQPINQLPPIVNVRPVQQPPVQQPVPIQPVQTNIIYKNDEEWIIERNENGKIKSVNIVRDVKVDK